MPNGQRVFCLTVILFSGIIAGCSNPRHGQSPSPDPASTQIDSGESKLSNADLERRASAHALYGNGIILEMQQHRTRALAAFRESAELVPENEELVWQVCRRFIGAQHPDVAIKLLEESANRKDAGGLVWARLAAVELQTDNLKKAARAAQESIRRDPAVLQGYQALFLARLQEGDLQAARHCLDDAEPYGVNDPEFLIQLSELYGLLSVQTPSNRKEIEATILRILNRASTLPIEGMLRLRLADGYANVGENERAAELYQELLETMPDLRGMQNSIRAKLTEAYLRGKDPAQARSHLKALLKSDPTNGQVCYLLGSLAYEALDFEEAVGYFRKVILLRPEFERAYYDLASVLLNLDRPNDADAVLAQARQKFLQSFSMEMLSAMVDLRRGEPARALEHLTTAEITAEAVDPDRLNDFFYFQFGAASEQAGDIVAAERHLKKCLELNPDFASAQNYLGYLWADRSEHLDEALDLIQAATDSDPENAAYLDSLGWVLFKLNRHEEALAAMQKALEHLEELDATIFDHLGDIHEALNDRDEAVEFWMKAYEIQPTRAVREKLKNAGQTVEPREDEA